MDIATVLLILGAIVLAAVLIWAAVAVYMFKKFAKVAADIQSMPERGIDVQVGSAFFRNVP